MMMKKKRLKSKCQILKQNQLKQRYNLILKNHFQIKKKQTNLKFRTLKRILKMNKKTSQMMKMIKKRN